MTSKKNNNQNVASSPQAPGERIQLLQTWIRQRPNVAAFIFFIVLTVIAAWPVVSDLDGVIIGKDNDVYINPWADWWTGKALSDPEISLWHTNLLFYPNGANLVYHSFSHLNSLVSLGLRPFIGPLPAYNITMLINLVLNGFSMFQLARYLTKSTTAALLAGIVFAFNSQITYQSSHPVLFTAWSIAWTTLYFIRAIRENSYRLAAFAAVIVFLGAITSLLMVILIALWLSLLVIFMFFSDQFPRPKLKILLTFGILCFIFILPIAYPLLLDAIINQNSSFVTAVDESLSTEIFSIIVPTWFIWFIRGMYLGLVPLSLFILAFRDSKNEQKLWLLLVILAFLIAIGPRPEFFGKDLGVVFPWSVAVIPLLRNTYRTMILFALGWAMIVAYSWLALVNSVDLSNRKQNLVALVIGILIFGEYTITPYPTTPATISKFYTDYLDDVPDDVALAILPTGRQEDKRYLFYQSVHEHPMTGGVISRAEEKTFDFIENNPLLRAGAVDLEPAPIPADIEGAFKQLADYGVGYFILDKMLMDVEEAWRPAIPFEPIYEDDLVLVYKTDLK